MEEQQVIRKFFGHHGVFRYVTKNDRRLPYYLVSIGCDHFQKPIIDRREDVASYYQWIQVTKGCGEVVLADEKVPLSPGMGFLSTPGLIHRYYPVESPWIVDWIVFAGWGAEPLLREFGFASAGRYCLDSVASVSGYMQRALTVARREDAFSGFCCSTAVYDVLLAISRHVSRASDSSLHNHYSQLDPALQYIHSHYQEIISLRGLAATVGVTPQYFCHIFKKTMGMRPVEYINSYRILKSKELMYLADGLSNGEIAARCGFENESYFGKLFKRYEGVTPGEFRKRFS